MLLVMKCVLSQFALVTVYIHDQPAASMLCCLELTHHALRKTAQDYSPFTKYHKPSSRSWQPHLGVHNSPTLNQHMYNPEPAHVQQYSKGLFNKAFPGAIAHSRCRLLLLLLLPLSASQRAIHLHPVELYTYRLVPHATNNKS